MIGFASEVVNVEEDGGNAVLTVLLAVSLQRIVTVTFTTSSGTATGKNTDCGKIPMLVCTLLTTKSISAC